MVISKPQGTEPSGGIMATHWQAAQCLYRAFKALHGVPWLEGCPFPMDMIFVMLEDPNSISKLSNSCVAPRHFCPEDCLSNSSPCGAHRILHGGAMGHAMVRSKVPTETSRQVDGGGRYITWPGHLVTETGFAGHRGPNNNLQPICISFQHLVTYGEVAMATPWQVVNGWYYIHQCHYCTCTMYIGQGMCRQ